MKRLTVARLRELAHAIELPLDDEDLTRLSPMVDDLLAVAQRLRRYQPGVVTHGRPSTGPTHSQG
jgi:hypothetical protein